MSDHSDLSGLQPPFEFVPLRDVALACLMFNSLEPYNDSLAKLRDVDPIDLRDVNHRAALLVWLNAWGCRHLDKEEHGTASLSIHEWYGEQALVLPSPSTPIWELDDGQMAQVASAYDSLRRRDGAHRTGKNSGQVATIGPTAASKVLFALRPKSLAPWDAKMRRKLGHGDGAKGYLEFLKMMRGRAQSLAKQCHQYDFDISELPLKLGRSETTTVVALLNEHMWVTVSEEVKLPSQEILASWAKW